MRESVLIEEQAAVRLLEDTKQHVVEVHGGDESDQIGGALLVSAIVERLLVVGGIADDRLEDEVPRLVGDDVEVLRHRVTVASGPQEAALDESLARPGVGGGDAGDHLEG